MESLIEFSTHETYEAAVVQADTVSGTTAGTSLVIFLSEPLVLEGANSALSNARVLSLRAEVKAEDHVSVLGYIVSVQGSIQKSEGARAVVLADLGNATKVVEFPFGDPPPLEIPEGGLSLDNEVSENDGEVRDDLNQEFVFDVFSLEQRPVRDNNPRMFHALPPFTICLTLHATRRTPQDYAVLMIDSIDIRAVPDPIDHLEDQD
jgi:hypothetical protein